MDVPFSLACNFKVISLIKPRRSPGYLTPYEEWVCALVNSSGAVALSQVCANSKQKQKLKTLARLGVFSIHRMEGLYANKPIIHNVLTLGSFPGVLPVLKRLALTHLLLGIDCPPVLSVSDEEFVIFQDDTEYRAFVHREPEPLTPFIVRAQKHPSFILVEKYYPELGVLDPDMCRVLLDTEDVFRLPDGTPENAVYIG